MGPSAKRRRLDKPPKGRRDGAVRVTEADALLDTDFSSWNTEQAYEQRRRKHAPRESTRLPIKTAEGLIEEAPARTAPEEAVSSSPSEVSSDDLDGDTPDTEDAAEAEPGKPRVSAKQAELEAREELSKIAEQLQVAPEEHVGLLKRLAQIAHGAQTSKITAWALGTQYAVYKDIIPGYRIRPLADDEAKAKLSKDVRRQRQFEQAIVKGYQGYVQLLSKLARVRGVAGSEADKMLSGVAIALAARLLEAVPHFNFRTEVLRLLIDRLAARSVDADFSTARAALERLFAEDEDGNASLEAAGMLSKMIRARDYRVDESVLNTFLSLRLLSELVAKASGSTVDRRPADERAAAGTARGGKKGGGGGGGWEVRSKKERKLARERKAVEKEMREADAQVGYEERDRNQSETLKIVFSVYLRVLKARAPGLMGAVLEGLVRYAHLINQDFFGDLLEALRDLVTEAELPAERDSDETDGVDEATHGDYDDGNGDNATRNVSRESLLCVITAFALLQGQDASAAAASLHLDLDFFIQHLYRTLYVVSLNGDIELSDRTLRAPDPYDGSPKAAAAHSKVNVQTTIVLLLRSLQAVLLPSSNPRAVPPVRLAAFAHRIMTSSLHVPHKSATAMLGVMNQTAKLHKKKVAALWNTEERRGDGRLDAVGAEVDGSNPFAGTLWQGELLRLHYAPSVRDGIRNLERLVHTS